MSLDNVPATLLRCALAVLWAATAPALAGCGASEISAATAPPTDATPVRIQGVRRELAARPVRATGIVVGKRELDLAFKMDGIVDRVLVDEGSQVRRGELLARLRQDEARSQLTRSQRALEKARRELERASLLHSNGVVPLRQLQDAETEVALAAAEHAVSGFNQAHSSIQAPDDGVILARLVDANEIVQAGAPALRLRADGAGWVVRLAVADRDVVRLRLDDRAVVRVAAYPDRVFEGRVTQIAAAATPATGTFDVEAALAPAGELLSGLHARADIAPSERAPVAIVPIAALLEADRDTARLFTVDGGGFARLVTVRVAFLEGSEVALDDGLDGVEAVVTDGAAFLRDGAPVRVVTAEVATAP